MHHYRAGQFSFQPNLNHTGVRHIRAKVQHFTHNRGFEQVDMQTTQCCNRIQYECMTVSISVWLPGTLGAPEDRKVNAAQPKVLHNRCRNAGDLPQTSGSSHSHTYSTEEQIERGPVSMTPELTVCSSS